MKILILCTGNSCRSQMAHGFLKTFDKRLKVASAGTYPGPEVNEKAVQVMREAGVDISSHAPVNVKAYLGERWDYVITVCDDARESCPLFTGDVTHRLHYGFEDPSRASGTEEFIMGEFRRIRDAIRSKFFDFYANELKPQL